MKEKKKQTHNNNNQLDRFSDASFRKTGEKSISQTVEIPKYGNYPKNSSSNHGDSEKIKSDQNLATAKTEKSSSSIKSAPIAISNAKTERTHANDYHKPIKSHKSRKSEMSHINSFENFLMDSANSKQLESHHNSAKRKSQAVISDNLVAKKPKLMPTKREELDCDGPTGELPALPTISFDDTTISLDDKRALDHPSTQSKVETESYADIDCTSKYTSQRKIWMPTRKWDPEQRVRSPENIRTFNGVSEHLIAQYDYQKLMAFEGDNRKLMRQTECFWEKLFRKVHRCYERRDNEKWRDAFLRVQRDVDRKLKELSARVRENNEKKIQAVNKAKLLSSVPVGGKASVRQRRVTDMRR